MERDANDYIREAEESAGPASFFTEEERKRYQRAIEDVRECADLLERAESECHLRDLRTRGNVAYWTYEFTGSQAERLMRCLEALEAALDADEEELCPRRWLKEPSEDSIWNKR